MNTINKYNFVIILFFSSFCLAFEAAIKYEKDIPYAVGIAEVGAIGYLDHCTGARDCSDLLPKNGSKSWNWEF